jgi:hypothetical protein
LIHHIADGQRITTLNANNLLALEPQKMLPGEAHNEVTVNNQKEKI